MLLFTRLLSARISTKIVLPYLALAILLAATVTLVAARLTAGSLQNRLDNRLAEAGQATSDGLVALEERQIEELRTIVFTEGVAEALAAGDTPRLERLLRPIWANAGLSTLVLFDQAGRPLVSWRRGEGAGPADPPEALPIPDLPDWWLARQILDARSDAFGDKFSAFRAERLWTSAPVRAGDALVGGAMVATPLGELLAWLQSRSQAGITTFYDARGVAVATTQILAGDARVPAIPVATLRRLVEARAGEAPAHIQDTVAINGRDYQLAYSPLRVRRAMDGYFAVALPRSFIAASWQAQRTPLLLLSVGLLAGVVVVGLLVARQITRPLAELVRTARAVAAGDLQRRSKVQTRDEVGLLSRAFNQMTGRLLHLYETSRDLGAQLGVEAILAQTGRSVERLVPGAMILVALREGGAWRLYPGPGADERLVGLAGVPLGDEITLDALAARTQGMLVAPGDARRFRALRLPLGYPQVCYTTLSAQGQLVGLLLILHREPGVFVSSTLEPLSAIAGMAATALHNVRLYSTVEQEGRQRAAILSGIADAVIVCDAQRRVLLMNPAAELLLDVRDWQRRRYRFDQLPLTPDSEGGSLGTGDGSGARYRIGGRTLSASAAGLPGADGATDGEVIVLRDISAEAALDQAKTDLIALISHELRTPLTAIKSASDMLCKGIGGPLAPLQRDLADTALRQSQAMAMLIDKAIMVAGIELGTLEPDPLPTGLSTVVEAAVAPLRGAAAAAETMLRLEVSRELPLVRADARLLAFALGQLVDNAIKYGEGSPVQIEARAHGRGVALTVRDRGPGIPLERQSQLFERLRRSDDALNKAPRGLGLGLVLARTLVERQGGALTLQSKPGEGCTFTIFLRVAEAEGPAKAA